jgi:hypothetical protein
MHRRAVLSAHACVTLVDMRRPNYKVTDIQVQACIPFLTASLLDGVPLPHQP